MKLSESSFQEIVNLLNKSLSEYRRPTDTATVTDIHIRALRESGEISVSDDDNVIQERLIPDLTELPDDIFYDILENELRMALKQVDEASPMESLAIWKPFSFVLEDDENETRELMLVDDDTVLADQALMQGLDEELDQFLNDLLSK